MAHSFDHHRMPGHDPLGGGMLATWRNLRRAVGKEQVLRGRLLTACILHNEERKGGRKERRLQQGEATAQ